MDPWRHPDHRSRLYENALNGVRYHLGKPLRFDPKLAARLDSEDREVRLKAWEEAATRV